MEEFSVEENKKSEDESSVFVRIRTTRFYTKDRVVFNKEFRLLKKRSKGYNIVWEDDLPNGGAEYFLNKIKNLEDCGDGVYEVVPTNFSKDWETGYVDDWDYVLMKA